MLALRHPDESGFARPAYRYDGVRILFDGSKETSWRLGLASVPATWTPENP
jgi:hypothetical protein